MYSSSNIPIGMTIFIHSDEFSFISSLNEYFKIGLNSNEIILASQNAEKQAWGVASGLLDQFACLYIK